MNLYYFAPADLQVARVDRQCIVRFCEALGDLVDRLEIVSVRIQMSDYERPVRDSLYGLYGVRQSFEITQLPTRIHQERRRTRRVALEMVMAYARFAFREFLVERPGGRPVVYLKNYLYAAPFVLINALRANPVTVVYEVHTPPRRAYQRRILRSAHGIVANSHALVRDLARERVTAGRPVLGIHQGVNLEYVESVRLSKADARRRLGLPADEFLAVYTGKVNRHHREIDYYIEAAARLRGEATVVVVGGRSDEVEWLRQRTAHLPNLRFVDFVPPANIYDYHAAADALLLYYPSGHPLNAYRSPGKLFEYMASGNPVVAADYPVLGEVLADGETAILVPPDNAQALADGILRLKRDPTLAARLAAGARRAVETHTWDARARKVYDFIRSL